MLWQRVGDLKPGGRRADEDVFAWANTRIRIQRSQRYIAELSVSRNTEAGAADPAECPTNPWRCFIDGQKVLARQPTEMFSTDLCVGCKGGSVKSSTH